MHTHTCQSCQRRVECEGDFHLNYDGWPACICARWHTAGNVLSECDECRNGPPDDLEIHARMEREQ